MANGLALRTIIATIQEICLIDQPKITLTEIHDDLSAVVAPLSDYFECVQIMSANKSWLTC